jgi:hypothetical protein
MIKFDFDEWVNLYKNYPEEFELKRKDLLEKEILKVPVSHRNNLRLLQMECDAYHTSLTPLAGTIAITQLMLSRTRLLERKLIELGLEGDNLGNQIDNLNDK